MKCLLSAFLLCLGLSLGWPASAALPHDVVKASLVAKTPRIEAGGILWLDLHFDIKPGWHTYWRNPGDSGLPTRLTWSLPAGWTVGDPRWPVPEHFIQDGVGGYGYAGQADLLTPVTVARDAMAGTTVTFQAHADWLVCSTICIPQGQDFTISTLVGAGAPALAIPAVFQRAEASLPKPADFEVLFTGSDKAWRLRIPVRALAGLQDPKAEFYPFDGSAVDQAAAQTSFITSAGLILEVPRAAAAAGHRQDVPNVLNGVLALRRDVAGDGGAGPDARGFTIVANPAPLGSEIPSFMPEGQGAAIWQAILLAFLGGVVLNAMPCVFPVFSLKILALARHAGASRQQRMREAAAYAGGILLSFAVLGGLLLLLRGLGHQLGWGFQLQSPVFVAILAYLLFAMGLGLSGVFSIDLTRLASLSLAKHGTAPHGRKTDGLAAAFSSGILATIVATPCTGPFMGTALGAALGAPAPVGMAIFLSLGAGLAFPFVLFAAMPALHRILPRPGRWMVTLRELLAFPLYATAAWLFWVLSQQVAPDATLAALAGLVLIGFAAWVYGRTRGDRAAARTMGTGIAMAALVAAVLLTGVLDAGGMAFAQSRDLAQKAGQQGNGAASGLRYESFSAERLTRLQQQGVPVFVNLTADWCLTCQINERLVLSRASIAEDFSRRKIVAMKGDWSLQDPAITAFLRDHDRGGVPLYLLYDGHGKAAILPQILTAGAVTDALSQLGS